MRQAFFVYFLRCLLCSALHTASTVRTLRS
ncbi:hypothetical protein Cassandra_0304 [Pseudomonas phage Cassandra]|nr:hypothetical protein Cassandra_0304 [Pseudomonas phage Cassandra]WPK39500.1 hypothetical protein Deiofobo_0303 [Pseudomonas phage Deifobo]WPK40535.1 hypothetical protein Paride_0305 [Pseudomonas phage Paride]